MPVVLVFPEFLLEQRPPENGEVSIFAKKNGRFGPQKLSGGIKDVFW